MAAPVIDAVFPNDGDTGVPLGSGLAVTFDQGIDPKSVKAHIVIYGPDFDTVSGPDSATWIDGESNPFFLKSPGFSGIVECDTTLTYVDATGTEVDPQTALDEASAAAAGLRHKVLVKPTKLLAPNTTFKVYIVGDSEGGTNSGISKRTVYDIDASGSSQTTGNVHIYGSYDGHADDVVHIKITHAGDAGAAKYKYWYGSDGEPSATTKKITSRRWRRLQDGLQVRFTGSDFAVGDEYTINVYSKEYLEDSYTLSFTTGTGSVIEVPSTASTSVIGVETSIDTTTAFLEILGMDPEDGSTHIPIHKREISIGFNADLDPATITEETVTVYAYPASGRYNGDEIQQLSAKLTVNNNELIVEL
ncbi:MAG: hypothetical protein CMF69_00200 [Magnetovibrio sp.]|nr:hypothetical protein [Magnetovibrio sp.]MBM88216.1 hypothetical protein [Gammaproteobacteria bacterium]